MQQAGVGVIENIIGFGSANYSLVEGPVGTGNGVVGFSKEVLLCPANGSAFNAFITEGEGSNTVLSTGCQVGNRHQVIAVGSEFG